MDRRGTETRVNQIGGPVTFVQPLVKDGFYKEVVILAYPALPEEIKPVFRDDMIGVTLDGTSQPLTVTRGILRDGVNMEASVPCFRSRN